MYLALNNLQRLICHKNPNNQITDTPHTHTHTHTHTKLQRKNTNARRKKMNEDHIIISQERRKKTNNLSNTPTNKITELNDLIYAGAKIVREKNGVSLKNMNRKSKPR